MKKTVIINLVASPCSGKSTLACSIFVHLKKLHLDVEYITEFAKDLIWEDRIDELNNQYYVSYQQYKILKNVYGKVDYIICDSPLAMSLFYNYYNGDNVSDVFKTSQFILDKMEEFQNSVYIFLRRNNELPYLQTGRIHTETQSAEIQENLEYLLKCCDINYFTMNTGDPFDMILEEILTVD